MTTTGYNIYSSAGFIGIAGCAQRDTHSDAQLLLFETIEQSGSVHLHHHSTTSQIYTPAISDIDMLRDLMQRAIPNLRNSGLTYYASSAGNAAQII